MADQQRDVSHFTMEELETEPPESIMNQFIFNCFHLPNIYVHVMKNSLKAMTLESNQWQYFYLLQSLWYQPVPDHKQ